MKLVSAFTLIELLACRAKASSRRRIVIVLGFTLIELLVVVAIIALLASLVAVAAGRSRDSTRQIKCLSNQRQLGLAAQMYWDDNSGNCFRYRGAATNNGDLFWFGWLERGAEGTRQFDVTQGALFPYLSGRGVEVCPALKQNSASFKLKATGAAYGFGYNLTLSLPTNQPPFNLNQAPRHSSLALFTDCAQVNTFQTPASPENPLLEEFYYFSTNEPTVHFRHRAKANVVFCDGHAAPESLTPSSEDTRLPRETIGRLRSEIVIP